MDEQAGGDSDDVKYYVYEESLLERLLHAAGWVLGWCCYGLVRLSFSDKGNQLADTAIILRRHNPGVVRAIGRLNGARGLPAIYRGVLLVKGRIHHSGPFANQGFYATYHVAAPNKARALALIERFEWDALPGSLEIEEGELDLLDPGAEGVLWIAPGRSFYSAED